MRSQRRKQQAQGLQRLISGPLSIYYIAINIFKGNLSVGKNGSLTFEPALELFSSYWVVMSVFAMIVLFHLFVLYVVRFGCYLLEAFYFLMEREGR